MTENVLIRIKEIDGDITKMEMLQKKNGLIKIELLANSLG